MTNNDLMRRLRFVLNLTNSQIIRLFAKVNYPMPEDRLIKLLKKDDDPDCLPCSDLIFCRMLDGLIIDKRGLPADGKIPQPTALTNNLILKKLRIALQMRDDDIINTLNKADFRITKSEINALFRNPEHKHFKTCGDQILRNFIKGLSVNKSFT